MKELRFEQLTPPYDMYSVTTEGHIMNIDTGLYVTEQYDLKSGKPFVVLSGSHKKTRKFFIAPLVAEMFIQNTHGLGYIYYKDGNVQNCHYKNIGWAINPKEGDQRVERPHRRKVEPQRHDLIVKISQACEDKNYKEANRLGKILWELEGANWHDRNKEVWFWYSLHR